MQYIFQILEFILNHFKFNYNILTELYMGCNVILNILLIFIILNSFLFIFNFCVSLKYNFFDFFRL